tara:strand:+ start:2211 stop:2348 length:138 start_codon:yes stop_codon:yes gene_type:complete
VWQKKTVRVIWDIQRRRRVDVVNLEDGFNFGVCIYEINMLSEVCQ